MHNRLGAKSSKRSFEAQAGHSHVHNSPRRASDTPVQAESRVPANSTRSAKVAYEGAGLDGHE